MCNFEFLAHYHSKTVTGDMYRFTFYIKINAKCIYQCKQLDFVMFFFCTPWKIVMLKTVGGDPLPIRLNFEAPYVHNYHKNTFTNSERLHKNTFPTERS